jgi:hypothetical protein
LLPTQHRAKRQAGSQKRVASQPGLITGWRRTPQKSPAPLSQSDIQSRKIVILDRQGLKKLL